MAKPYWLFVAGIYRSGSTTQYQITRDIVEWTGNGIGIGYHTETKLNDFDNLGKVREDAKRRDVKIRRPNPIVVCKVFWPIFDKGYVLEREKQPSVAAGFFGEGRVKAVATVRNPLDIITSMKRREEGRNKGGQSGEWDFNTTVVKNFPIWLGQLRQWIDLGPSITYFSRFEDFTQNLLRETKNIAQHLEIDLSDKMAKDIARQYTVQAIVQTARVLRERNRSRPPEEQQREDPWLPSIPGIVFGSSNVYRTWLSTPEIKLVIENHAEFMKRFGYDIRL